MCMHACMHSILVHSFGMRVPFSFLFFPLPFLPPFPPVTFRVSCCPLPPPPPPPPGAGTRWEPNSIGDFEFVVDGARSELAAQTSAQVDAMISNMAALIGKAPGSVTATDAFEYYMGPLIEDVWTKLTSVYNRAPDDAVAIPTRRDALLYVWVVLVTMLHGRSVEDLEDSAGRSDARVADTEDDPEYLFGGMPTAADGYSAARHRQMAALLGGTRYDHTTFQTDAGQVGSDVMSSNLLARVAMGPPGSQWTADTLSHDDNKTTIRATGASKIGLAGVLVGKRWVIVYDMTTLAGLGMPVTCFARLAGSNAVDVR